MGKDSYKDTDYYGLCILHQGALGVKDEAFRISSLALNLPQPPVKPNIQLSMNDREKWSSFHLPSYPNTTQPAQERDKDSAHTSKLPGLEIPLLGAVAEILALQGDLNQFLFHFWTRNMNVMATTMAKH